jgi:hypothetical protein
VIALYKATIGYPKLCNLGLTLDEIKRLPRWQLEGLQLLLDAEREEIIEAASKPLPGAQQGLHLEMAEDELLSRDT